MGPTGAPFVKTSLNHNHNLDRSRGVPSRRPPSDDSTPLFRGGPAEATIRAWSSGTRRLRSVRSRPGARGAAARRRTGRDRPAGARGARGPRRDAGPDREQGRPPRSAWPGIIVEDGNLTVQIAALRKALGTAEGGQDWIATVPRVGYRLVVGATTGAPVEPAPSVPSLAVAWPTRHVLTRPSRRRCTCAGWSGCGPRSPSGYSSLTSVRGAGGGRRRRRPLPRSPRRRRSCRT